MKEQRKPYTYQNRTVYEWDESLDTVYCYIELPPLPPHLKPASLLQIFIQPKQLTVGFKDTPPYLQHQLQGIVDTEESVWYIEEAKDQKTPRTLVIELQKAQKGVRWGCVFVGHGKLNVLEE